MDAFKKALAAQELRLTNAILSYDDKALIETIFSKDDVLETNADEDGLVEDSLEWLDARDMQHDMISRLVELSYKIDSARLVADNSNGFLGWVGCEEDYVDYINGLIKEDSAESPESIKEFREPSIPREVIEYGCISLAKAISILTTPALA